jgi:hypothetical protein
MTNILFRLVVYAIIILISFLAGDIYGSTSESAVDKDMLSIILAFFAIYGVAIGFSFGILNLEAYLKWISSQRKDQS